MIFLPVEIIKKKRRGLALSEIEIESFISGYTNGTIPDYQMSALLMAICFQGMTKNEQLFLTKSMLNSGETVVFQDKMDFKVDKHSTGGVGDKTSLIIAPIVAACGISVPMISGRGLGHTGGTLDKLESIPGFEINKSLREFVDLVDQHKLCFIGQTKEICPADRKIYALRDVTATVESLPLICASIMSKKIAEGIDGLVLDVKYGNGAFMKTLNDAKELAEGLSSIGCLYYKKVKYVLSNMDQPLGRFAGNAHEVFECLEIMANKTFLGSAGFDLYEDTKQLSLRLASEMIHLARPHLKFEDCMKMANNALMSGDALRKFHEICKAQGGNLENLALPTKSLSVLSNTDGYLESFDTEKIGMTGIIIKAGRMKSEDKINPLNGIEFHYKIGDSVKRNTPIFTIHGSNESEIREGLGLLETSFTISLQKTIRPGLIEG